MRLDISILVAAAAVGAQAKAFHLKYPGPLVRTKRPEKPEPKAPEVTALQLDSEAEDHGKQWVEVVTEINANTIKARDDGGLLEGCHGKECGKRFYVDEPKKEEHYADEGFEEKYWVEQITSHKEDSHRHKSEVDHHDYYHRYNDTDDHYHHHHHKDPKKGKKAKLEAREADLSEGEGEVPEGGDNDKLWTGPVVKATPDMRKEAKERINAIKRYQKRADTLCSEERPKQLYTKGQEDLERKSARAFLTFCKTVDAVKKLIGEIAENRAILHQKVKLCLDKKIEEKHEAPAPHNEWDTRSVEQRLEALCWKELYQADKVPKIQPKLAAREASPLSAEAAADGEEYIRKRIHELKEKKKEEEEKEKKHDHKDDIEYYREEILHETDESHYAEHHHDSFYNVHHKPIHHHHHHDKQKGEEAKGRKAKKVETRDVDADVEGDYHEGLASENVCTYFRGIAYKAKSLHRPVEQFQHENVPWLVHARGPWHHVLEGLRQIEWVLAKVARGLHETSGFTAKEERELVGCYYAFAGINSPNGDNGQPFKKLLHLLSERSKMAKYEPYAQKRVHDVVRNLETAYLTANDQLFRVMRQDKYRANILWDVEDKDGAPKYFAEVLRVYDVEKDKVKV